MDKRVQEDIELGKNIEDLFNNKDFFKKIEDIRKLLGWSWTYFIKKIIEHGIKTILNDMSKSLK